MTDTVLVIQDVAPTLVEVLSPSASLIEVTSGPQGAQGATGATGATGPTGPTGPAGELVNADIGVTIQGYSANLAAWSALATSSKSDSGHNHSGVYEPVDATILRNSAIGSTVQGLLVSGTSIKTINSTSLLGSGDLVITASGALTLDAETFSLAATVTGGTNAQGQGAMTKDVNIVTSASANPGGVTLPATVAGRRVIVINRSTVPINVYPAASSYIDALAINASIRVPAYKGQIEFNAYDATHWQSSVGQTAAVISTLATGLMKVTTTTGDITTATAGSDYMAAVTPSTSGNVLTSNGSSWVSLATLTGVTEVNYPYEVSLGSLAGNVSTGLGNTQVGFKAAELMTSGAQNTTVGYLAANSLDTGSYNVTIGAYAGHHTNNTTSATMAANSVRVGAFAGYCTTNWAMNCQMNTTFIGYNAGYNNPSNDAVVVGHEAGYSQCGGGVVIGAYAMRAALQYQTGVVVIGYYAGYNLNRGDYTVAIGASALATCSSGTNNVAMGYQSGYAVTTGGNNVLLGHQAGYSGVNNLTTGANNILIGYQAAASAAGASNETVIGNASTTSLMLHGILQAYTEKTATANTSTAYTIAIANGTLQVLTLTGNCTFTFPTATAGKSFTLLLKQDGTGSRTATWPAAVKWPSGTAPTLTATASKLDRFVFTADGTNWYGGTSGLNYTV